jgi:hypothetical protein
MRPLARPPPVVAVFTIVRYFRKDSRPTLQVLGRGHRLFQVKGRMHLKKHGAAGHLLEALKALVRSDPRCL